MAKDWASDVKKYVPGADDEVIAAIVSYCGISLQKRDSSLVAYSDPNELNLVRENFLKKKLGLTDSDEKLDGAIAAVGARLKGVNFKNRPTVYYMLLEELGLLHMFRKDGAAPAVAAVVAAAVAAPAAKASSAPVGLVGGAAAAVGGVAAVGASTAVPGAGAASVAAAPAAMMSSASSYVEDDGAKGGLGWLPWLLLGLLALAAIWWFFLRAKPEAAVPAAPTEVTTAVPDATVAPDANMVAPDGNAVAAAEPAAPVAIPAGAGITSETRDGKPLVKVYFDTAKTDVVPAFVPAAQSVKTYLDANPTATLGVSGYNDPRGNVAANAKLSKDRADAVKAELMKIGIPAEKIELIKPTAATDGAASLEGARRVEVYIK